MKKFALLVLSLFFCLGVFSQQDVYWRNDAATSNWWDGNNPWYRACDSWWLARVDYNTCSNGSTIGGNYAHIDNNNRTSMTVNGSWFKLYTLTFENTATSARTLTADGSGGLSFTATTSYLTNLSTATHTFNTGIGVDGAILIINANVGQFTFNNPIYINSNSLVFTGSSNNTANGVLSGAGTLTKQGNGTLLLTGANSYTGTTTVSAGILELQTDLNSSSTIIVESGATLRINGVDVDIQALTINSGGTVEVAAGKSLTVNGVLTNNGTLNLKSNSTDGTATLKALSTVTNGGANNYNVEQYLSAGRNWYISSPVNAAANTVITGTSGNVLYYRNEPANSWPTDATTFAVGSGYVASIGASNGGTYTFNGSINNNEPTVSLTRSVVTKAGFNLVGNPYPCYYIWNKAQADASNLLYTVWYRTKEGSYTFHTFNVNGEVSSPATVSNYIPPMQAFWVRVDADSDGTENLTFLKANRSHADAPTNKLKAPKVATNKILRLDVSNGTNSDETVLYFNNNAADTYDGFDSPKMTNSSLTIPELYTTAGSEQLVINGMQTIPLDTEIPLGFRTQEANNFIIKTTEFSGFESNVKVFIKDNQNVLNPEQELTAETSYNFSSDVTDNTSRFSVIFKSAGVATGLFKPTDSDKITVFANENNQITVNLNSALSNSYSVEIYNSYGQKVANLATKNSTETINKQLDAGVYFVKVNINEKISTRKVIIR